MSGFARPTFVKMANFLMLLIHDLGSNQNFGVLKEKCSEKLKTKLVLNDFMPNFNLHVTDKHLKNLSLVHQKSLDLFLISSYLCSQIL